MWWNRGGLTSGGAECVPVRVFLVPSFLRLYVPVAFVIRGCEAAGLCGSFGVRRGVRVRRARRAGGGVRVVVSSSVGRVVPASSCSPKRGCPVGLLLAVLRVSCSLL